MDKRDDGPGECRLEFPDPPPTEPEGELQVWASSSEPDQVSRRVGQTIVAQLSLLHRECR